MMINARITDTGFWIHLPLGFFIRLQARETSKTYEAGKVYFGRYGKPGWSREVGELVDFVTPDGLFRITDRLELNEQRTGDEPV